MNNDHRKAQELSSQANLLMDNGKMPEARKLFFQAAKLEELAIQQTPDSQPRTKGILAVSFVAMLFKARRYNYALTVIDVHLKQYLLPSARKALNDIRKSIRKLQKRK